MTWAILVFHGIGQQARFETLDLFARGLRAALGWGPASKIVEPRLVRLEGGNQPGLRVKLRVDGAHDVIDFYEVYWAPLTQGKIDLRTTLWWLVRSALTPALMVADNLRLILGLEARVTAEEPGAGERRADRKRAGSLIAAEMRRVFSVLFLGIVLLSAVLLILWLGARALGDFRAYVQTEGLRGLWPALAFLLVLFAIFLLQWVGWLTSGTKRRFPRDLALILAVLGTALVGAALLALIPAPLRWGIVKLLVMAGVIGIAVFVRRVLIQYVGDIVLYLAREQTSRFYETRRQILEEALALLRGLLRYRGGSAEPELANGYERVALVAHSLGSVIAYDALSRLVGEAKAVHGPIAQPSTGQARIDLERIRTLITLGSPLDKVYYFFRERIPEEADLRRKLVDFLYPRELRKALPGVRWVNFWSKNDPISGPLDYYGLPAEANVDMGYRIFRIFTAHVRYWRDPRFYASVARDLGLRGRAGRPE